MWKISGLLDDYAESIIHFNKVLVSERLLKWYAKNGRSYPWRKNRTPYRVLISEIMLQRTQTDQVAPVFREFVDIFPHVHSVVESDVEAVESVFQPLGLINRAAKIHEMCAFIRQNYDGQIPESYDRLVEIKGIGKYTASTVLCFGFGHKRAIVDVNVERIYTRLFNVHPKNRSAKEDNYFWEFCRRMLPDREYVEFNYALLDFGKMDCDKRNPNCFNCIFSDICLYYEKEISH